MNANNHWIELNTRAGAGLEVALLWRRSDGAVAVSVYDSRHNESHAVTVPSASAADAFWHPFAYLSALHSARLPELRPKRPVSVSDLDVDELWISELAAETLARLSEFLGSPDGGENQHDQGV